MSVTVSPRSRAAIAACVGLLVGACSSGARPGATQMDGLETPAASGGGLRPVESFAGIAEPAARSAALFEEVGKVLTHPRCVNCHPASDSALQGEGQPHQPLVVRGADGRGVVGMRCNTCHGDENFGNVPGDPDWHLAPASMAWEGKSLAEICEQIKDPARNGGKDLRALVDHMADDPLVAYGWNPPEHLEPAPGTQALAAALFAAWAETGAHCPGP